MTTIPVLWVSRHPEILARGYADRLRRTEYSCRMPKGSPGIARTEQARFDAFVDKNGPRSPHVAGRCWIWESTIDVGGYGSIVVNGRKVKAHRWVYEREVGQIPDGLTLDHLCSRPECVRPSHMDPVTLRENILRGRTNPTAVNARKTHCIHGHELSGANLIIRRGTEHRDCRTCTYARIKRYKQRQRSE